MRVTGTMGLLAIFAVLVLIAQPMYPDSFNDWIEEGQMRLTDKWDG